MFHRIFSFLKSLLLGGRFGQELDEEMAFHLGLLTEDLIRSGRDPRGAKREALLLGSITMMAGLNDRRRRGDGGPMRV